MIELNTSHLGMALSLQKCHAVMRMNPLFLATRISFHQNLHHCKQQCHLYQLTDNNASTMWTTLSNSHVELATVSVVLPHALSVCCMTRIGIWQKRKTKWYNIYPPTTQLSHIPEAKTRTIIETRNFISS